MLHRVHAPLSSAASFSDCICNYGNMTILFCYSLCFHSVPFHFCCCCCFSLLPMFLFGFVIVVIMSFGSLLFFFSVSFLLYFILFYFIFSNVRFSTPFLLSRSRTSIPFGGSVFTVSAVGFLFFCYLFVKPFPMWWFPLFLEWHSHSCQLLMFT